MKWFCEAADQGNTSGVHGLGILLVDPSDRRQDFAKAVSSLHKAADKKNPLANFYLSAAYLNGWRVPKDEAESMRQLRASAELGYAMAQDILAARAATGQYMAQNNAEAFRWYKAAAEQGDPDAQVSLGKIYRQSQDTPDAVQAYKWLTLAEKSYEVSNDPGERLDASNLLKVLGAKMTPTQIAEAKKLADAWKPSPPTPSSP